jgi:hypothetical protein
MMNRKLVAAATTFLMLPGLPTALLLADNFWRDSVTIATTALPANIEDYKLVTNEKGDAIIVWTSGTTLYFCEQTHGQDSWSPVDSIDLSSYGTKFLKPLVALDNNRNAALIVTCSAPNDQVIVAYKMANSSWGNIQAFPSAPNAYAYRTDSSCNTIMIDSNGIAYALYQPAYKDPSLELITFNNGWGSVKTFDRGTTKNYESQLVDLGNGDIVALWNVYPNNGVGFSSRINGIWSTPSVFGTTIGGSYGQSFIAAATNNRRCLFGNYSGGCSFLSIAANPVLSTDWTTVQVSPLGSRGVVNVSLASNRRKNCATAIWNIHEKTHSLYSSSIFSDSDAWGAVDTIVAQENPRINWPCVAVDSNMVSIAAWTFGDSPSYVIQYAFKPAGGSWSIPDQLSTAGEVASLVQVSSNAKYTVVAWVESSSSRLVSAVHKVPNPEPPTNFEGTAIRNRFAAQSHVIHTLSWTASESNDVYYQIYADEALTDLIGETPDTSFVLNNVDPSVPLAYYVVAVDDSGNMSESVSLTLHHKTAKINPINL